MYITIVKLPDKAHIPRIILTILLLRVKQFLVIFIFSLVAAGGSVKYPCSCANDFIKLILVLQMTP